MSHAWAFDVVRMSANEALQCRFFHPSTNNTTADSDRSSCRQPHSSSRPNLDRHQQSSRQISSRAVTDNRVRRESRDRNDQRNSRRGDSRRRQRSRLRRDDRQGAHDRR